MKEIIVAEGLFSKMAVSLKDETVNKLAFIKKKDNPLALVEADLKRVLDDFERKYFAITHPEAEIKGSDVVAPNSNANTDVSNPPKGQSGKDEVTHE